MQHGDFALHGSKARLESFHRLRSQGNFRHKHQSGFSQREGVADALQVDFRFSTAGHPVQENRQTGARLRHRFIDRLEGDALLVVETEIGRRQKRFAAVRIAGHFDGLHRHPALTLQGPENRFGDARLLRQLGHGPGFRCRQRRPQGIGLPRSLALQRGQFVCGRNPHDAHMIQPARRHLRLADNLRQHAGHGRFQGAAIVFGNPPRNLQEFWADEGSSADGFMNFPGRFHRGFVEDVDHRAKHQPGAEGNPHP